MCEMQNVYLLNEKNKQTTSYINVLLSYFLIKRHSISYSISVYLRIRFLFLTLYDKPFSRAPTVMEYNQLDSHKS